MAVYPRSVPAVPLLFFVALSVLLTACSGSPSAAPPTSSTTTPPPTSPSVSATPSPDPTATAKAEVLAVYRGYWAAKVAAHAAPAGPVPKDLSTYAIAKAQTDTEATILRLRQQGIAFRGAPVLSPDVTTIDLGQASAAISDCVDSTHWLPVFVATGKSALAPGQPMRVIVESTARIYSGRWVIDTSVAHRDRTC